MANKNFERKVMAIQNIEPTNKLINEPIMDISPKGISIMIGEIHGTGLDSYNEEVSEHKRARNIGTRRPFITKMDATLRALKESYPTETKNKNGVRQPNREYQRASLRLREYRRQISSVQSADRLTLIGKPI